MREALGWNSIGWNLTFVQTKVWRLLKNFSLITTKKLSKPCITGPWVGESTGHQWIPSQRANNAESVFMSWDYHMQFLAIVMVSKESYLLYDVVQLATSEAIFIFSKYLSGMFANDGSILCKSKFTARKIDVHQKQNVHFKNAVKDIPYHQISNISRTKSQNSNVSRLVLQLSLPSLLKPFVKSRMKM